MKLSFSGEAQKHQGIRGGTYFLQEDKTNNKPYWIHKSDGKAIWWDKEVDKWNVGDFENLGSAFAGIKGPSNNDSPPNQITNGWKYTTVDKQWLDTNGVHFEDWTFKLGKLLHLLCKNSSQSVHTESKQMSHFYDIIITQSKNNGQHHFPFFN